MKLLYNSKYFSLQATKNSPTPFQTDQYVFMADKSVATKWQKAAKVDNFGKVDNFALARGTINRVTT